MFRLVGYYMLWQSFWGFLRLAGYDFEPHARTVTIYGVRYSIELFRDLGIGAEGTTFRIIRRERDILTVV